MPDFERVPLLVGLGAEALLDEPVDEELFLAGPLLEGELRGEADLPELEVFDAELREELLFGEDPELFAEPDPRADADFVAELFAELNLAAEAFAVPEPRAGLDFVPELLADELDALEPELRGAVVLAPEPFEAELLEAALFEAEVELLAVELFRARALARGALGT